MYQKYESQTQSQTNNYPSLTPDKVDNSYYDTLYKIHKLFKTNNYISKIGAKADPNSVNQNIIYYHPENITHQFSLQIHNKNKINITIPIKNSNSLYTTTINSIEDTHDYITLHLT